MSSLRKRLFVILVAATGIIWLSAVAWIYLGSRAQLEHVLDTRLQEAARMVSSLVAGGNMAAADAAASVAAPAQAGYERQLSCQIWSLDGRLVARSSGAPDQRLTDSAAGFSEQLVGGETWRVFTIEDASKGVRVMVGDRLGLRDRLVADLIKGLMAPALLIVPMLGLLIWASIGTGLRPLRAMAGELRARGADDMSPIDTGNAPSEVKPLADALNGLFIKVEAARRHEREVTAFAAHELRTPLAGLKTQAQIAIAAADPAVKEGALRQILVSVDRTTRLVRQLLVIARLDAGSQADDVENVNPGELLDEIIDGSRTAGASVRIDVDPALYALSVRTNREMLKLALRNLHENALEHMSGGGTVVWRAAPDGDGVLVEDEGPGIPDDELALVTQRFYRGRHKSRAGTGLGLAITELAAKRLGGRLMLKNRGDAAGLSAAISLPAAGGGCEGAPTG